MLRRGLGQLHFLLVLCFCVFTCLHGDATEELFTAIANGNASAVETAINGGANIEATNTGNDTPLLAALKVTSPSIAVIEKLLTHEASVEVQDEDGNTPLLIAVKATTPSDTIISLLLDSGADVDAKDGNESAPLHYAANNVSLCKILLSALPPVDISNKKA